MIVYFKIRPSFCNNMVTNFTIALVQNCIHLHHIIIFTLYLCFDLFWYLGWYWDSIILSNINKFASWFVKNSKTFCNHTLNNQQNILKHFTPIQIYKYIWYIKFKSITNMIQSSWNHLQILLHTKKALAKNMVSIFTSYL